MARFYTEEGEIDVQDPLFFIQEAELIEYQETIEEILSLYA